MGLHKRTKTSRLHGSHTHGWGNRRKHRGKGRKGGRGNAGTGKRADQKKPSVWMLPQGKNGFKRPQQILREEIAVTTQVLAEMIKSKKIQPKEGIYDLETLGYTKLIAHGAAPAVKVKVAKVSKGAKAAVEAAGGSIVNNE